jgi:ubiquinone/menaquinone biosynthesis C-methylase UbiE/DNA-binding transcriptional ArsR family regulator
MLTPIPANHSDDAGSEALLSLCKASADPLRLDILRVLSRDSFGVMELCRIFETKQSGMSHHLKILATAGLLTTRREGNSIFYRRAAISGDSPLDQLQQALITATEQLPLSISVQQQLAGLHKERATHSQQFFAENADKFSQQQEQIAAFELYGVNAAELIDKSIKANAHSVLEVGPGEGAFLATLSPRFEQVFAVDNSAEMLAKARAFASANQFDNIELINGDTRHPSLANKSFSCIVVNMVLHHLPSPAEIFFDLAKLLEHEGQLFITELCSHDQSWAQDACGDLWLGFEPKDLTDWASAAGFHEGQSVYLSQRNGFRVQIREFIKMPEPQVQAFTQNQ